MATNESLYGCCSSCGASLVAGRIINELREKLKRVTAERQSQEKRRANQPEVVCLCGSSRFVAEMAVIAWTLERDEGKIVLGLHLLPQSYGPQRDHQAEAEGVAEKMDELHLRKIDLADRVLVVNIGGYIGESTRKEVEYAKATGKPLAYLEPLHTSSKECTSHDWKAVGDHFECSRCPARLPFTDKKGQ